MEPWRNFINSERLWANQCKEGDIRNEFQRDYDRIIFSNAFRRLQGKTQVFPLPESDMTHNRLTHSLEVSCVGRALGNYVGRSLGIDHLGDILAAASLAHDIGNPPFGHTGEKAISFFFESKCKDYLNNLNEIEKKELLNFEGNALGFRILTKQKSNESSKKRGFGLTCATLGAFSKYPCKANFKRMKNTIHHKKYGFFNDDYESFECIALKTSLKAFSKEDNNSEVIAAWYRHPLAYLTEASDDICYRILDFEDGYRLNLIPFEVAKNLLEKIANAQKDGYPCVPDKTASNDNQIIYLRKKAISNLVLQAANIFIKNVDDIINGGRESALLDEVEPKSTLAEIQDISIKKIYSHYSVIQIEAAGYVVIPSLLERFLPAVQSEPKSPLDKKIHELIPDEFKRKPNSSYYSTILNICEYVAGMTDTYAIDLYRTLYGISLPNYRP